MQSELSGFPNCAGPAAMSLFPFSQTLSSGLLCQLGFRLLPPHCYSGAHLLAHRSTKQFWKKQPSAQLSTCIRLSHFPVFSRRSQSLVLPAGWSVRLDGYLETRPIINRVFRASGANACSEVARKSCRLPLAAFQPVDQKHLAVETGCGGVVRP